jgi:hypothetical protein
MKRKQFKKLMAELRALRASIEGSESRKKIPVYSSLLNSENSILSELVFRDAKPPGST